MKETKYTVKYTTSFKKDYKRAIKRGLKIEVLEQVVALLAMGEPLPDKNTTINMRMVMRSSIRINFLGWYLISFHAIFILVLLLARRCPSSLAPIHTLPSYHKWGDNRRLVFGEV